MNSSQRFSSQFKDCWSPQLTKSKAIVTLNHDHGCMIYDETYNASINQRLGSTESNWTVAGVK